MDIASLLAALTAASGNAAESNPFAPLKSASDTIGAALLKNAANMSTKDNLLGGLLTGLASGVTGNLATTYQDKQDALSQNLLLSAFAGNDIVKPDEMPASVFNPIKNTLAVFNAGEGLDKRKELRQAELDVAKTIAAQKALMQMQQDQYKDTPLAGIMNLPEGMRTQAMTQLGNAQQQTEMLGKVDQYFDEAKDMNRLKALNPWSTEKTNLDSISSNLFSFFEKYRGNEASEPLRKEVKETLPLRLDTDEQIEAKRQKYKERVIGVSPSTPLVPGNSAAPNNGMTKEQARAELRKLGVPGY